MDYDRTISENLASLIAENGKLRWLFEFVKNSSDLDFLIGKNKNREWISIYRGTTKLICICYLKRDNKISMTGAKRYRNLLPELYGKKNIDDNFQKDIENLITKIKSNKELYKYYENKKEGYYQNELSRKYGICGSSDAEFVIIDKEVVVGYKNQDEKNELFGNLQKVYKKLRGKISDCNPQLYGKRSEEDSIGNELDFLALDKNGNLLLIEYKHGDNTSGIYLSPLQLGLYYDIFKNYEESNKDELHNTVFKMLEQKQKLGLVNPNWHKPESIKEIKPVLIISEYNCKSSAKTIFNEIVNIAKKEKGDNFLSNLQTYNYTSDSGLENW